MHTVLLRCAQTVYGEKDASPRLNWSANTPACPFHTVSAYSLVRNQFPFKGMDGDALGLVGRVFGPSMVLLHPIKSHLR